MGTISKSLKSLSSYPIPLATIEEVAEELGLNPSDDVTPSIRNSNKFKLAKAGIYDFLSEAPNISQAGVSYSFSDGERKRFKANADSIRNELDYNNQDNYGYQGEDL